MSWCIGPGVKRDEPHLSLSLSLSTSVAASLSHTHTHTHSLRHWTCWTVWCTISHLLPSPNHPNQLSTGSSDSMKYAFPPVLVLYYRVLLHDYYNFYCEHVDINI